MGLSQSVRKESNTCHLNLPRDVLCLIFSKLDLKSLKTIAATGNRNVLDAARVVMQRNCNWYICDETSVDDVNALIDRMQSRSPCIFNVRLDSYKHIPLLKKRGAWNQIRGFRYDGNEPGLELPKGVQHVRLWHYSRPELVLPDSVEHVQLGWYNQPGLVLPDAVRHIDLLHYKTSELVLPDTVQYVHLGCYNQPALVLPYAVQHVRLYDYNQPGLVLPDAVKHVHLGRYNHPGLVLPDAVQYAHLLCYTHPDLVLPKNIQCARIPRLDIHVYDT